MDTNDLRTFRLLEEIERSHSPSQRELAQKLNISLGLVNAFMKRLAKKGLFKSTTTPKKRLKYILTSKGFSEKSRLAYEYVRYSFRLYREARSKVKSLFIELEKAKVERIVLYGVSDLAEIAFITLQETDLKLVAVIDDKLSGSTFLKHLVKPPDFLLQHGYDAVIITLIGPNQNLNEKLKRYGVPENKTKRLY